MQSFISYIHQGVALSQWQRKKINVLKNSAVWESLGRYLKAISVHLFIFLDTVTKLKREIWQCLEICHSKIFLLPCLDLPLPQVWRFHFTSHQLCRPYTSNPFRLFSEHNFSDFCSAHDGNMNKVLGKVTMIVFSSGLWSFAEFLQQARLTRESTSEKGKFGGDICTDRYHTPHNEQMEAGVDREGEVVPTHPNPAWLSSGVQQMKKQSELHYVIWQLKWFKNQKYPYMGRGHCKDPLNVTSLHLKMH